MSSTRIATVRALNANSRQGSDQESPKGNTSSDSEFRYSFFDFPSAEPASLASHFPITELAALASHFPTADVAPLTYLYPPVGVALQKQLEFKRLLNLG